MLELFPLGKSSRKMDDAVLEKKLDILIDSFSKMGPLLNKLAEASNKNVDASTISFAALVQSQTYIVELLNEIKGQQPLFKEEKPKIIEKKETPIESFVYSLQLARDRFATTASQKKSIDSVIKNIQNSKK